MQWQDVCMFRWRRLGGKQPPPHIKADSRGRGRSSVYALSTGKHELLKYLQKPILPFSVHLICNRFSISLQPCSPPPSHTPCPTNLVASRSVGRSAWIFPEPISPCHMHFRTPLDDGCFQPGTRSSEVFLSKHSWWSRALALGSITNWHMFRTFATALYRVVRLNMKHPGMSDLLPSGCYFGRSIFQELSLESFAFDSYFLWQIDMSSKNIWLIPGIRDSHFAVARPVDVTRSSDNNK